MATKTDARLADIAVLFANRDDYHLLCLRAIEAARTAGYSWMVLAEVTGYTRQGITQWFDRNKWMLDE